jgi:hypothetical protein
MSKNEPWLLVFMALGANLKISIFDPPGVRPAYNKGKSPRKSLAKYSSKSSGKYGKLLAPPRCNLSASLSSGLSLEEIYARRSLHSCSLPCVYHVNDQARLTLLNACISPASDTHPF